MKPTNGHTPYRHIRRRLVTRNKKSQGKWFKEGKKKEVISKMRIQLCRKEKFLFLLFNLSYLNVSGYSWSSTCYYTRTRVHNSSSHIIVSITSVATGVYAVAHVNICTIVCLPLIRIRMRNDYAWKPVFDKNKSNKTKHNKIQQSLIFDLLYSSARVTHCVRFGKQNDIRHPGRMGNMKRSPQP